MKTLSSNQNNFNTNKITSSTVPLVLELTNKKTTVLGSESMMLLKSKQKEIKRRIHSYFERLLRVDKNAQFCQRSHSNDGGNLKLEWRELGSGKQRDGRHLSDVQKTIN